VDTPRKETVERVLSMWVRMLSPFVPFVAEELWSHLGKSRPSLVSEASWPKDNELKINEKAETVEWLLSNIVEDARNLLRILPVSKKRLYVYTPSQEKADRFTFTVSEKTKGKEFAAILKELSGRYPKESTKILADEMGRIFKLVNAFGKETVEKVMRAGLPDEHKLYSGEKDYLKRELGLNEVSVFSQDSRDLYDPKKRASGAMPAKPGLYLE
jgi:leucyl-tRNA synthetase